MHVPHPLTSAVAVIVSLAAAGGGAMSAQASTSVQGSTAIVVSPVNLHGWQFFVNNKPDGPYAPPPPVNPASTASYTFQNGPGSPPAGTGSLLLDAGSEPNSRISAVLPVLQNSVLDDVRSLSYATYVTKVGSGQPPLPAPSSSPS